MPLQKGKKRRKPRRHNRAYDRDFDQPEQGSRSVPAMPTARKKRGRWEAPLWLNLVVGISLLVLGILFLAFPQKGLGGTSRLIILLGYFALAGLYLSKAVRQYRERRQL